MNKPESKPELSIVIVNYHAWDKLQVCLNSLHSDNQENIILQVVVVNNDPQDKQFDSFCDQFEWVKFVNNEGNLGFAHGCNTGALHAVAPVLLFLNPDTRVPKNCLSTLMNTFATLPAFSILATHKQTAKGKLERVMRFFPSMLTVTGIGKALHRALNRSKLKKDFSPSKPLVYPDWVSGCVIIINRQDFVELNGWDTRYWMYSEDADLCKRAAEKGGSIALQQDVRIEHDHGGSSRINPHTTALTKTEVLISHHVFASLHFAGIKKALMQIQYVIAHTIAVSFWALIALPFFSQPKAQSKRLLWRNLAAYYRQALRKGSWLSPRSTGLEKRFKE